MFHLYQSLVLHLHLFSPLSAFAYHLLPYFLFRPSCLVNTFVKPIYKRSHASLDIRSIRYIERFLCVLIHQSCLFPT